MSQPAPTKYTGFGFTSILIDEAKPIADNLLVQILGWKPHIKFWLAPDRTPDEPLWQADPGAASEEETLA